MLPDATRVLVACGFGDRLEAETQRHVMELPRSALDDSGGAGGTRAARVALDMLRPLAAGAPQR